MAQITCYPFIRHLRADPTQFVLHFSKGRLVRSGRGLSYWFGPLSAAVAQVPVEDLETTFVLRERSADFQEVSVQITITYRITDPEKAAQRMNFTVALDSGVWVEQPLERLAGLWALWARHPVRACLAALPVADAVRAGPDQVRGKLAEALRAEPEQAAMGLALVAIQVAQVAPSAELEKALQTPTREAIQQKADEAAFARRALAVEKERAIKENELDTQVELARRQEQLIRREGANKLLGAQQEAERQKFAVAAEVERQRLTAEGAADVERLRAETAAAAERLRLEVLAQYEAQRVQLWQGASPALIVGLALQHFGEKIARIEHLNVTPDLLGDLVKQLLLEKPKS